MKALTSIVTERTYIRRLRYEDEDPFVEMLSDNSVTDNMAFPDEVKTPEGAKVLLKNTIELYESESPLLAYGIEGIKDGYFLGLTGLNPLEQGEIEVFYALLPKYRGKGFATEILKGLTEYVFTESDYPTVVAPITQYNSTSIKVAEKCGFKNYGLKDDPNYKELIYLYKKKKA